jgi:O-antigen/teichoic acid export membrane protein
MSSVKKAVIYSSLSRYVLVALGLFSSTVIARLLTPEEIGTFAIASSIVMILSEFRLLGAGVYLVRQPELTDDQIRSALGVTILISFTMGGVIAGCSSLIASFYSSPELEIIIIVLTVNFFIAPFISVHTSLLQRDYNFKALFFVWTSGVVFGFIATVICIFQGFSYYSLALGLFVNTIFQATTVAFFTKKLFLKPKFSNIKPIISLGIYSSLSNFFNKSIVTAPDIIIGKVGSALQVGMFSRGLGFVEFLSSGVYQSIAPVALPYLSSIKNNKNNVTEAYTMATVMMGAFLWPVLAVASLTSLSVIRFFFGDQWDAAAPIASIIAVWAMLKAVHSLVPELLLSCGKEKLLLFRQSILLVVLVTGIYLLFDFGLFYASFAFLILGCIDFIFTTFIISKSFDEKIYAIIKPWLINIPVTIVCATVTLVLDYFIDFNKTKPLFVVLILATSIVPAWYLSLRASKHPLLLTFDPIKSLGEKFKKSRSVD